MLKDKMSMPMNKLLCRQGDLLYVLEDIITQLGSTAVVISIGAYVAKKWIEHQIEKMSTQNSHELARQLAKLNVHEPYLHKRRTEVIEAIRSEERRVGKECRYGWWREHYKKKKKAATA